MTEAEAVEWRKVLREARPEPALPPRFRDSVWCRIQRDEIEPEAAPAVLWLERVVTRLLRPRMALAGVLTIMLLGAVIGVLDGTAAARQVAQDRYVAVVAPHVIR
ncbi:MAG: hypothetical protein MUE94_03020 [Verrucomicrobia bacterium]|nr:hypothetical protein [Verrucomicrobiota bacterium]